MTTPGYDGREFTVDKRENIAGGKDIQESPEWA